MSFTPFMYTRLQTVWSLPDPSRQANKGHSPRCHRRPNGPGRFADKVFQPTTQSAEECTYMSANYERLTSNLRNQLGISHELKGTVPA